MYRSILKSLSTVLLTALVAAAARTANAASFDVYGFAQLDYIQDFNRVNPAWDATLRPSRIPTTEGTFGSDGQAILSVRQSRLGAKSTIPTEYGDLVTKFEFDMFGVGTDEGQTTIRLRHAYGQLGHVLAGQTNSLFMDGDIFPNTIDYWGPAGMVFYRTPQLRWTQGADKNTFSVAIEVPGSDVDPGQIRQIDSFGGAIQGDEKLPDFTAQARTGGDWGHLQLAGIARYLGYETIGTTDNEPKGHETGWGLDLTSVVNVRTKDALRLGVVFGQGIASYMNDGGMDLAPDGSTTTAAGLSAKAVPLLGVSAYYDVWWSDKWSSSVGYAFTQVDNTDFQTPDAFHLGQYASANILYYPVKDVFYGIEYLYGRREDNDGNSGQDQRVQISAHYNFSLASATGQ
jgi:hypothetical protein